MKREDVSPGKLRTAIAARVRLLVAVSALLTFLGSIGNSYWLFELFSHFVAWFAVGTTALAILLWVCRAKQWAAAALLLAAAQAAFPLSWYLPERPAKVEAAANFSVLLANVYSQNKDTGAFLDLVSARDPDIVCVQEVSDHWRDALVALEQAYPVHLVVPRPDNFGIAIYSRMEGPPPELVVEEAGGVPAITMQFIANGRKIQLLNLHAVPPAGRSLAARRKTQLAFARQWIEAQTDPAILIGDLNLTVYSPAYRRLASVPGCRNARAGRGPMGTWPAWLPLLRLPIDHCLVRGIYVVDSVVPRSIGSDHRPLFVDLSVPAP